MKRREPNFKILLYVIPALKGREYKWGGNGEINGEPFDCFGMIVEYVKLRKSINILEEHSDKGYDFFNYSQMDDYLAMGIFKDYLSECFLNVNIAYKVPGDILYCEYEDTGTVGIYLGNGNMLVTSPRTNCIVVPTEYYELKGAYRWPLLSQ
jgi:cell wall-associated NlpC family hydrolase